jgi:hypothetical protein
MVSIKPQDPNSMADKTTMDLSNSLTIKSSGLKIEIDAIPNAKFFTGYEIAEDLIKFESNIDFEIVFKMTDGDCSNIYDSKDMGSTFLENCVRVEKFKLGNKVDFKKLIGHFTEDNELFKDRFEEEFMANINEKTFDIYYESLI